MTLYELFSLIAALFCGGLAISVFLWDRRSFVHRVFALGMIVFSVEEVVSVLSYRAILPVNIDHWQRIKFIVTAFLPGIWLLFSLSFSRANYKKYLAKWRWVVVGSFVFPLTLITLFGDQFFRGFPEMNEASYWMLPLGWSGYMFHTLFLVASLLILMNLESTFRGSSGAIRWQIKFMVLGVAGIFAVRIFTTSQNILFHSLNSSMEAFNTIVLIASSLLIMFSLVRSRLLKVDIYLSETMLYRTLTFLIAGIYLIVVGILAKALTYFRDGHPFFIGALFVFLALLGLTVILLSNELRQQIRRFIYVHFQRPRYDYRKEWTRFTHGTVSLLDIKDLCGAVAKMVSETFGVPSSTLWLVDDTKENLIFGGSTAISQAQGSVFEARARGTGLLRLMQNERAPIDLDESDVKWVEEIKQANPDLFRQSQIRYAVPLSTGNEFLGIMTLNERITGEPFSLEDFDLLKTIADQAAGGILNIKMSERLTQAKEMEAFQTMSAFFVHDLKNLASKLSLTVQNLPLHYENEEFRKDAIRAISDSVNKINSMCGGLSLLRQKIVLQPAETDLNKLIGSTLAMMKGCKGSIAQDLTPLPSISVDPEQVQKVITNLILNANEAVSSGGEIRVATKQGDGWIALFVSDNGCGMSREFMERSLFRPFKTTKKQGMGIGLFHCKMIVEAHQGRIEVESEEGQGTTFRVFLPLKRV
ncbi:MAG: XrtA/PEP-CTERM system histidine kinase PrsK [Pseudobdellovibrionaceae bacterium]